MKRGRRNHKASFTYVEANLQQKKNGLQIESTAGSSAHTRYFYAKAYGMCYSICIVCSIFNCTSQIKLEQFDIAVLN